MFLIFVAILSRVTRGLSQGGKISWNGPIGHCRRPTCQHSEKKLEKWWWIRMWMAIVNLKSPKNTPKNAKKTYWNQKILKPKYTPSGEPIFTFSLSQGIRPSSRPSITPLAVQFTIKLLDSFAQDNKTPW